MTMHGEQAKVGGALRAATIPSQQDKIAGQRPPPTLGGQVQDKIAGQRPPPTLEGQQDKIGGQRPPPTLGPGEHGAGQRPPPTLGEEQGPHSAALRRHRRQSGAGTFFVTKSLHPRQPLFGLGTDEGAAQLICEAFCHYHHTGRLMLGAFVVMPDHWHALFAVPRGQTLPRIMRVLNGWVSKGTKPLLVANGCSWQDGYYETRIRSSKQFCHVRGYIEENPVRAGLVECVADWPWSSASPRYAAYVCRPWPWDFEDDG